MSPTGKLSPRVGELLETRRHGGTRASAAGEPNSRAEIAALGPEEASGSLSPGRVGREEAGEGRPPSGGRGGWRGGVHKLRAPQPRSAEVSATGYQGAPAPAIVAGPCGRRLQAGPSPRIPRPARPAPGAAAAGTRTSCRRGRVHLGGRPPAAVIVRRAPPTSAVPAAPGPGCVLRAEGCRAGEGAAAAASEGSPRAAGARARQAAAGRGPSHQRWRGAERRAEQAGWVGSAIRVAVAASTPGRSATRTERSGAERAAAASPPRAFFAPLPALRSCCARAGTSRLRGWRAGSAGHHRPSLGLGRALGRGSLGTAWGQRRTTAPSSVRAVTCAGAPGPAPLAPPGRQVRGEVARRQGRAAQPRNGALLGRVARAALGAAPPSRAREEEPPPRGERWSLVSGTPRAGDRRTQEASSRWREIRGTDSSGRFGKPG